MLRGASLFAGWCLVCGTAFSRAEEPRTPVAAKLAARLADPSFHDREAASQQLVALGLAAVPALEDARRTGPPEAVRRATRALAAIRLAEDSRQAVDVKPVSLNFQGKPLSACVAEVRAVCGANVALDPKGVADPNRRITFRTAELPPWQAVERFCAAAGLREVPPAELEKLNLEKARIEAADLVLTLATARPADVPVVWKDGEQPAAPMAAVGGLRVMALPTVSRDPANGVVTVALDVTTTAGVNWQRTDEVRVGRAETPDGRRLEPVHSPKPAAVPVALPFTGGWKVNDLDLGEYAVPALPPPARLFAVELATGSRPADRLKVLEGVVCGEVYRTNQTLLELPDLSAAVGRTFDGPLGSTLTVEAVKPGELALRCQSVSPWALRQQGLARSGAIGEAGFNESVAGRVKVFDADGKELPRPLRVVTAANPDDTGSRTTTTLRFTFPYTGPDRLPTPARLVVTGTKVVPVRVPFRLENVPLK